MITAEFISRYLPQLLHAALTSISIAFLAALLGFIGGTILGLVQSSKNKLLKNLVTLYVTIIRGTPMLLQIMFLYLMLPQININISAFTTAVIAIGINSSAYISQIIRSGIKSVSQGQIEAARTLGINNIDLIRYIILPQALRVVIPALANEFITLIKDSSLASLIGVVELYMQGNIIISQTHDALSVYLLIGIIYLIITTCLSVVVHQIEKRLNSYARN